MKVFSLFTSLITIGLVLCGWESFCGGKVFPERMLLQCLLWILKDSIQKHHSAFSLGTQTEAQLIQKLSNMHFLMGQNHSPHYLTRFINRAVRLKHLLG